jgi:formiminoglutamase
MFQEYFESLKITQEYQPFELGYSITKYVEDFPTLEDKKIALIGVPENFPDKNPGTMEAPSQIRSELYNLVSNTFLESTLVDLGNIKSGKTFQDTVIGLKDVTKQLQELGIVTIVLGGSIDLGIGLYNSFEDYNQNIETSFISSTIPILEEQLLDLIVRHEPNHLLRLNALAFQGHYMPPKTLDVLQNLNFGHLRLGALKKNIEEAELLLRNTHLTLFDISAVKHADAPGNEKSNPIGLEGDMACQLAWYAGVSDTSQCFGLFEVNPLLDVRNQTSKLAAQIIWYFIDGFANRKQDHPILHEEFFRYRCSFDHKQPDILFHKSKRTNRWWMEIPHPRSLNNADKNIIIPCLYSDYLESTKGDLPDRYLNAIQLLH